MKNVKKILMTVGSFVLTAALAIGGTVAYLTWQDSDVNVMTLGNVKIEQIELQRKDGVDYKNGGEIADGDELEAFEQGQLLFPSTYTNLSDYTAKYPNEEQFWWGDYVTADVSGNGSSNGLWDDKLTGAMDKFVFVKNTGKSDAYYRTIIAFECPNGMEYSQGADKEFMMNVNGNSRFEWQNIGYTTIDGERYLIMVATYQKALQPGTISRPSLLQVVMTHNATNEDMELLGDTYEILVLSQAVQTAGFEDAETALDTAFGEITTDNHPWSKTIVSDELGITEAGTYDLKGDVYTIDTGYFHTQKVTDDVTLNGNGATVEGIATSADSFQWEGGTIPAMSAIFSSENGSTVTVNDISFTGTMSAIMMGHYKNSTYNNYNTVFNNVNVIDTKVVSFSSNIAPAVCAYGTATLNNCNIYGTTLSELDTDPMWPVYDLAAVNYTDVTINNSKIGSIFMWNQAKVTVAEGSEVDTIVIRGNMNTKNYGLTIKAGVTVDTIDLSNITDKAKINITIEDGAVVNNIVANDETYDSIDAWRNA